MDEHAELINNMAEVYLAVVRELRTENSRLKSENESLRTIIKELREASDTIIEEGGKSNV